VKAIRMHAIGGPEVLQLDEVDIPSPVAGEVLIEVAAASVAFGDVRTAFLTIEGEEMAQEAFMEKFRACYLGDDLNTFMEPMDEGAVWTSMATGETFKGREQIRAAAEKSMAGRVHMKALHMELKSLFSSDDMVCIELCVASLRAQISCPLLLAGATAAPGDRRDSKTSSAQKVPARLRFELSRRSDSWLQP